MNIRKIIREEYNKLMETSNQYGSLANPKNIDPNDPEIVVKGFGSYSRTSLRDSIASRLSELSKLAKSANTATDPETANRLMRNLAAALETNNALYHMVKADVDVAEQLESIRTKGGRRSMPIPKQ